MSLVGFRAENHTQQTSKRGAKDAVDDRGTDPEFKDTWCREESCEYRNWRSGDMPTHRRGSTCPAPSPTEATK